MPNSTKDVMLKVTTTGIVHDYTVRVDDEKISFTNGAGSVQLSSGVHTLAYIAIAAAGTIFKIEVTEPPEAEWSREVKIGADGTFIGAKKIYVNKT